MPMLPPVVAAGALCQRGQPILTVIDDLVLRPWRMADAPDVLRAYADPDIQLWNLRTVPDETAARELIGMWLRGWQQETTACWAITSAEDTLLGRITLRSIDLARGRAMVGYWVLPEARGRGASTAALRAVLGWGFDEIGLHRVALEHSVFNAASCRVAVEAGFPVEGTLRSAEPHTDGWHDMHLHAAINDRHDAPVTDRGDGVSS